MKTVSIQLDDYDYECLSEILESMGQTEQTLYVTFTKTVVRLRKIPFIIEAAPLDPFYSESNMEQLHHSYEQIKNGHVVVKTMEELEAMAEDE